MSRGGRKKRKHQERLRKALDLYLTWVKYKDGGPHGSCPHADIDFGTSPTGLPTINCYDCGEYATGGGVVLARKRAEGKPTPPLGHMEELGGTVPKGKPGTGKTKLGSTPDASPTWKHEVSGKGTPPQLTPDEQMKLVNLMKKVGQVGADIPSEEEYHFLHYAANKMATTRTAEEKLLGIFNKGPVPGEGPPPPPPAWKPTLGPLQPMGFDTAYEHPDKKKKPPFGHLKPEAD